MCLFSVKNVWYLIDLELTHTMGKTRRETAWIDFFSSVFRIVHTSVVLAVAVSGKVLIIVICVSGLI